MQAHQPGDKSSPPRNNYEEQTQPRRSISQPKIEAHYELEFENESSIYARKLFVDAERMSLTRMDLSELNIAENGNQSRHSRSFTRSTSHNTSLSRTSSYGDPITTITTTTATRPPSHSPTRLRACGTYSNSPIQTSPERERRKSREEVSLLRQVPEDGGAMEFHSESRSQSHDVLEDAREDVERDRLIRFPVLVSESPPPHQPDSQSLPVEDADEEEEEQWILDEELARQGLYRGSYRYLISLYTLTPAFTLLVFLALAYLPTIAYPLPPNTTPSNPYPYTPYLPYPLPEILTAAAFWALSYLLNSSIFSFFSFILSQYPPLALCSSSLVQSAIVIILRQITIPVLLISCDAGFDRPTWRDVAFRRTWWIALGWAAAEAAVGIKQGYEGIALYRDVLVSVRRVTSAPRHYHQKPSGIGIPSSGYGSVDVGRPDLNGRESPDRHHRLSSSGDQVGAETGEETQPLLERHSSIVSSSGIGPRSEALYRDAIEEEVERDVDELIALRTREELEDLYGMPFIHVPPFIPCLHRLNSALFVLGSTLLVTAAYMRSSLSLKLPPKILSLLYDSSFTVQQQHLQAQAWPKLHGNTQLLITLPIIVLLQWFLALLHTPYILPRIGVQTFVYVGLLVSLGVFFTGLGVWEGIV